MLRIIEEKRDPPNIYSVAYDVGDNFIKVVRVGEGVLTANRNPHVGQLQIQRIGLDLSVETLEFEDGRTSCYDVTSQGSSSMLPFVSEKPETERPLLVNFGAEFKELFKMNEQLKLFLPIEFKPLVPYIQ
jgi:hypothetical protein